MYVEQLGDFRTKGVRQDGWLVVVTVEIIGNTNMFEINACKTCDHVHVRRHNAEAWRLESAALEAARKAHRGDK